MENKTLLDRYRGAMFGLAVGDALGTTLENQRPPKETLKEIVGGGPFQLLPGEWTDDTSTSLLLAESLIENRDFKPQDQLTRYLDWYREGKLSSNGECFDIGIATRMSLETFAKTPKDYPASEGELARAGNGSLMRFAPIPLFYRTNPLEMLQKAVDSSRTTHGSALCTNSCRFYALLFLGIFEGATKEELLVPNYIPKSIPQDYLISNPLREEVATIANGSYKTKQLVDLKPTGYVIDSLECALWAFHTTENFADGLIACVNLGGDSDTIGAIYGQLAGCYYGYEGIPEKWRNVVTLKSVIQVFADELLMISLGLNWKRDFEILKKEFPNDVVEFNEKVIDEELSYLYKTTQTVYRALEELYKPVKRKLNPGPHAYKTMPQFDSDFENFEKEFRTKTADVENPHKEDLWNNFRARLENNRSNLKNKLERGGPFKRPF